MADTGFVLPGAVAETQDSGERNWENESDALVEDSNYATTTDWILNGTESYRLEFTNFGFAIPTDATIDGIECQIRRIATPNADRLSYQFRRLFQGGSPVGDSYGAGSTWGTSAVTDTFGGPTDLQGLSLTPSDINDSGFGLAFKVKSVGGGSEARIYWVKIKIYYTEAAGGGIRSPLNGPIGLRRPLRRAA